MYFLTLTMIPDALSSIALFVMFESSTIRSVVRSYSWLSPELEITFGSTMSHDEWWSFRWDDLWNSDISRNDPNDPWQNAEIQTAAKTETINIEHNFIMRIKNWTNVQKMFPLALRAAVKLIVWERYKNVQSQQILNYSSRLVTVSPKSPADITNSIPLTNEWEWCDFIPSMISRLPVDESASRCRHVRIVRSCSGTLELFI